jgi:hypothetical protein
VQVSVRFNLQTPSFGTYLYSYLLKTIQANRYIYGWLKPYTFTFFYFTSNWILDKTKVQTIRKKKKIGGIRRLGNTNEFGKEKEC